MDLKNLTIKKASELLEKGEITSVSLVQAYLEEIKKKDGELNSYREVFDDAIAQAKAADEKRKNGGGTILTGIPISLKDNILIEGKKAGASSKILEGYVAPYSSTAAKKLLDEGVVVIGRTNMDEFAMGGSTENSAYGVTKNPHDTTRVAGGSSGGSAASVAADLCLASFGSDTGGSIRQPASLCGVVGFKPSYGRVSRHGLMAMGSSLDQIGPFTKTVEDAEILFKCIQGIDPYDATTVPDSLIEERSPKKRIGIMSEVMDMEGLDEEVKKNFSESIEKLKAAGYEIIPVSLPNIHYSLAVYYILVPAEVSSNMARFDGMRFGAKISGGNLLEEYMETRGKLLGREVKRRIMIGTYVLSHGYYDAFYGKATLVRNLIKRDFEKAFEEVDAILTPTTPSPAFKIGEKASDPLAMYLADIFTVPANLTGSPSISLPSGKTQKGLPLGIQLTGPYLQDEALLQIAKDVEKALGK